MTCRCGQLVSSRGYAQHMLAHVERKEAKIDWAGMPMYSNRYEFIWLTKKPEPINKRRLAR